MSTKLSYRDLDHEPATGGVRVTGTEVFETPRDCSFLAYLSPDRAAVLLAVCGGEYAMPAMAARLLASALVEAADAVDPVEAA